MSESVQQQANRQTRGAPHGGPGTLAVHAGERQPVPRRPAVVPVFQTAPFVFDGAGELFEAFSGGNLSGLYSRYSNPTVRAVEEKIAALEGAEDGVAFASGMAAITGTLSTLLHSGERLVAAADLYGGTHQWLLWLAARHPEVTVERVALDRLAGYLEGLGTESAGSAPAPGGASGPSGGAASPAPPPVRVVYLETPTNPLLSC